MENRREEHEVYVWFHWGVLLKGLLSVIEVLSGIAILFVTPALVHQLALFLVGNQLAREPFDEAAAYILTLAYHYTSRTAKLLSFYFLSRGIVKTGLVWALLRNKLWAYPLSLAVMAGFLAYQVWEIVTARSFLILVISLFDLVIMYLIWKEWRIVRAHGGRQVY